MESDKIIKEFICKNKILSVFIIFVLIILIKSMLYETKIYKTHVVKVNRITNSVIYKEVTGMNKDKTLFDKIFELFDNKEETNNDYNEEKRSIEAEEKYQRFLNSSVLDN